MDSTEVYIPSGANVREVIRSLNDYLDLEIALPGNWSPTIFYADLKAYPVNSKKKLADSIAQVIKTDQTRNYLEFFEETRGYPRPGTNQWRKRVWELFSQGSLMLYFEPTFLKFLESEESSPENLLVLAQLELLAKTKITQWNEITTQIGAACFQFFAQEPELYIKLLTQLNGKTNQDLNSNEQNDPELMKDRNLLEKIKLKSPEYLAKSRSDLIKTYQELYKFT